jgi:hypothetical protein
VGEVGDALLLLVGHAHVTLEQVELQRPGALQLEGQVCVAADGNRHLVVHALPLHEVAAHEHAGAGAHAGVDRFAVLHRLVRRAPGTAHRGDAEGEVGTIGVGAEVLLQV